MKSNYVVQASRLTKIFLPEFQARCVSDPESIHRDEPFTVIVPRAFGAIVLEHNKPVHVSSLIKQSPTREAVVDETRDLVPWLTESEEADQWGVVTLEVAGDFTEQLIDMDLNVDDPKKQAEFVKKQMQKHQKLIQKMKDSVSDARQRADERVLRLLRVTHRNLVKQWETNQSSGMGTPPVSDTEALGAFILAAELEKANAGKQKMVEKVSQIIKTGMI